MKRLRLLRSKPKITEIKGLDRLPIFCAQYLKWHRDVKVILQRIFGADASQVSDFMAIDAVFRGMRSAGDLGPVERRYRNALQEMDSTLTSIHQEIEEFGISIGDSAVDNPVSVIEKIVLRFHAVVRQLRARHGARATLSVKDEYDVQDLFHALLRIFFKDVRPEEWTPSYASNA